MTAVNQLIARRLAAPKVFRVTTAYDDGRIRTHDTETAAQAENWATGERRKIGRELTDRETDTVVRVVSVIVDRLQ